MKPPKPLIMGPGHGGGAWGVQGGTWGAWGCSTQEVWWRWAISRVSQSYSRCLAVSGGVTLLQGRLNPLTKENHTKKHKCYHFEMRQTKQDKYRVSVQKGNTRGFTIVKLHRFSVYFVIHPCTSQSISFPKHPLYLNLPPCCLPSCNLVLSGASPPHHHPTQHCTHPGFIAGTGQLHHYSKGPGLPARTKDRNNVDAI